MPHTPEKHRDATSVVTIAVRCPRTRRTLRIILIARAGTPSQLHFDNGAAASSKLARLFIN